ncbi:BT4734/BF3469 family protein [Parabacteroides pacaensis]|uniref:BT4734/BF3469 family protein n=1 Tax=Parabacteroides pacaensis TaxID=2086575 RepID=UPI000D10CE82|nr:BT4734/BF3469 family protein [Parabacteroides pacaensis]
MKVTQYRYEKGQLLMRTMELSAIQEALRVENRTKPVTIYRQFLPFILPGQPNKYFQRLPQIAFGVTYKKMEKQAEVRNYTGLVLLEIAHLANGKEAALIRQQASRMPQTLLAFIGCDGKSVEVVIPFVLPDGTLPGKIEQAELFHAHAYRLAVKHYQPAFMRNITLNEPSIEQACRMSYDPDLYYNPEALPIRMEQPKRLAREDAVRIIPQGPSDPSQRLLPGVDQKQIHATFFSVAFAETLRSVRQIKDSDLQPFLIELAQNCYRASVPEEEAVCWLLCYESMQNRALEIRKTFRSVYGLKEACARDKEPELPEVLKTTLLLDEFMKRRYELRRNEMSGAVEYRDRSLMVFDFKPLTKEMQNSMCMEAHQEGLNVWDKDIARYVYSDRIPLFHPLEHYLYELPVWDGTDRIREVANRIKCNNPLWADQFYRWFLGMVAHWQQLDREHGNSTVPLLVGNQGCGKSTFCLQLLPPELRAFYTDSIDFSNRREVELALHRFLLINMDEFETVKPSQQSYVKHVLQKAVVNTRLPHQSAIRSLCRYGAFIATANNFDLLTDPTGSRRFICVEVKGKIDTFQPIEYDQLFSQALTALEAGERFWFTSEEEAVIMENNARFQQQPAEEQFFHQYFRAVEGEEEGLSLLAVEILQRIRLRNKDFNYTNKMVSQFGRLLKRNNIPSRRTKSGTYYLVKELV